MPNGRTKSFGPEPNRPMMRTGLSEPSLDPSLDALDAVDEGMDASADDAGVLAEGASVPVEAEVDVEGE
jgi:hypothetical protein